MRIVVVGLLMLGVGAGAAPRYGRDAVATAERSGRLAQLETAVDGTRPDEPALYPLLLNMQHVEREDARPCRHRRSDIIWCTVTSRADGGRRERESGDLIAAQVFAD